MSFLSSFFGGSSTDEKPDFWNIIQSDEDVKNAVEKSFENKVIIFKHSTRCFISKSVLKRFENEVLNLEKDYDYYFLDLLKYRTVSNNIASDFEITHQSPQIIVLENGMAIKNASHEQINLNSV